MRVNHSGLWTGRFREPERVVRGHVSTQNPVVNTQSDGIVALL